MHAATAKVAASAAASGGQSRRCNGQSE